MYAIRSYYGLYELTGIEYMEINTLNQLLAAKEMDDPAIQIGEKMLFTADMLQYFLSRITSYNVCYTKLLRIDFHVLNTC